MENKKDNFNLQDLRSFLLNIKDIINQNILELESSIKDMENYKEEIDEEDKFILGLKNNLEEINLKIGEYLKTIEDIIDNKKEYNEAELENLNKEVEESLKALEELVNTAEEGNNEEKDLDNFYPIEEIDNIIENEEINEKEKIKLLKEIEEKLSNSNKNNGFTLEDILKESELLDENDLQKALELNNLLKSLDKAIEENNETKINKILDKINQFIKEY
ncbi:MAG: hypothetical protein N2485_01780 [bacterium]|nr:hypothetical protein [bacterium]